MSDSNTIATPAWPVIFGYEDVPVKLANGDALVVRVRIICVRQAFYLLGIIEDEFALLEYVASAPTGSLPEGWIDSLTSDSHALLVEKARSLNFPILAARVSRAAKFTESSLRPMANTVTALRTLLTSASSSSAETTPN
jgi:hypothetical protein